MKRKNIKLFTLVLMSILLLSSVVQGKSILTKITANIDESINITWNGTRFTPKEDNGTIVHPIVYNGRTYLPVRFIAEKAGVNVRWNEETKTVILKHSQTVEDNNTLSKIDKLEQENKKLKEEIEKLKQNTYLEEKYEYDKPVNSNQIEITNMALDMRSLSSMYLIGTVENTSKTTATKKTIKVKLGTGKTVLKETYLFVPSLDAGQKWDFEKRIDSDTTWFEIVEIK